MPIICIEIIKTIDETEPQKQIKTNKKQTKKTNTEKDKGRGQKL